MATNHGKRKKTTKKTTGKTYPPPRGLGRVTDERYAAWKAAAAASGENFTQWAAAQLDKAAGYTDKTD